MFRQPMECALVALPCLFLGPAAAETPVALDDPATIEAGRDLFNDTCAGYCHGRDATATAQARSFHGRNLSVDYIHGTIREGIPARGMPAWEGVLADEEIRRLTAFLASLQEAAPAAVAVDVAEELPDEPLRICAAPDRPPYEMEGGDRPGFEVEIGRAILEAAGLEAEVAYNTAAADPALFACDVFMGRALPARPERLGDRFYTEPYYGTGYLLALPGEPTEAQGVAVEAASFVIGRLDERGIPVAAFSSPRAVLAALAAGEVEGALVRAADLAWHLREDPDAPIEADLAAEPDDWARWNVAMEVHRPAGALADALNAAIGELTADGTIAAILEAYGVPHHPPFRQTGRE